MTGHKIDFIALDGPLKTSRLLLVNQPLPQVRGHVLHIIFIQPQFLGNLPVGQI